MQRTRRQRSLGLSLVGLLCLAPIAAGADQEFDKKCARVIDVQRKVACGDNSLLVVVQNICGHSIQISVCVQKMGGEWDCGLDRNVQPEQKVGRWVCEGTGEYKFLGCSKDGTECNARPQ